VRIPLLVLLLLGLLAGCDDSSKQTVLPKKEAKRLVIGVVPRNSSAPWRALRKAAVRTATLLDVNLIWETPSRDDDAGAQLRSVDALLDQEVDAIAISPVDAENMAGTLLRASKRAPLVFFLCPSDLECAATYIATNSARAGQVGATEIARLVGAGNIALLRTANPLVSQYECEEAFKTAILEKGLKLNFTADPALPADPNAMKKAIRQLADGTPRITGIFASTEKSSLAALAALEASGWAGDIKLVGTGCAAALLTGLDDGKVHALVIDDMPKFGDLAVRAAITHAQRQTMERVQVIDPLLLTPANRTDSYLLSILQPGQ
jgi:ABC-type sugar transport system substrate-binding protein